LWCGAGRPGGEPPTQGFSVLFRHGGYRNYEAFDKNAAINNLTSSLPLPDFRNFSLAIASDFVEYDSILTRVQGLYLKVKPLDSEKLCSVILLSILVVKPM
jgi:hypothetical protein